MKMCKILILIGVLVVRSFLCLYGKGKIFGWYLGKNDSF